MTIRIVSFFVFSVLLLGQTPPPSFKVASIKPSNPPADGPMPRRFMFRAGGILDIQNIPLREIISFAYNVRDFQVSGGPGWISSDLWIIQAKPESPWAPTNPRGMTEEQRQARRELLRTGVRNLLANRFQLKVHRETKELPVYALVVDKNGIKFNENTSTTDFPGMHMTGTGQVTMTKAPMPLIVQFLSNQLQRSVIDETGLKGSYDLKLEWAPDQNQLGPFGGPAPGPGPRPGPGAATAPGPDPIADPGLAPSANGPTLFSALRDQLGLKLESKKGPVDIIVIDRVEKPSEN